MIPRQYLRAEPVVAASYLFGCGGKAMGAAVGPVEQIERYLRDAEALVRPMLREIPPRPPRAERVRTENVGLSAPARV